MAPLTRPYPADERPVAAREGLPLEGGTVDGVPAPSDGGTSNLGRSLRSSGKWAIIGRFSSVLLLLLLHAWLARAMSKSDYGQYVILESATIILSLVVLGGFHVVGIRMLRQNICHHDQIGATAVVLACTTLMAGMSILTIIGTFLVAMGTQQALLEGLLWTYLPWVLGWAILAAFIRLLSELARAYERFSLAYCLGGQSGGYGVNSALLAAATVVALTAGLSLSSMLVIQIAVQVLFFVLGGLIFFRLLAPFLPSVSLPLLRSRIQQVSASTWPLMIQQLVAFGLPEIDMMLVGSYLDPSDAATYGAARRLALLVRVPLLVANIAIQPYIADLHTRGERQLLITLVRGSATLAAIPSMLVVLGYFLVPEVFLRLAFGEAFVSAGPALRILSIGCGVFVLAGSCGLVLTMIGRERSSMMSSLISGSAYVAVAPFVVARYGITGAAMSAIVFQVVSNVIGTLLVYQHEKFWTVCSLSPQPLMQCCQLIFPGRAGKRRRQKNTEGDHQ